MDGRLQWHAPARQLNFGGSSSAAAGHGSGAGGDLRQRANSDTVAPGHRSRGTRPPSSGAGGDGLRGEHPRADDLFVSFVSGRRSHNSRPQQI